MVLGALISWNWSRAMGEVGEREGGGEEERKRGRGMAREG